jgi:hypothetical protein
MTMPSGVNILFGRTNAYGWWIFNTLVLGRLLPAHFFHTRFAERARSYCPTMNGDCWIFRRLVPALVRLGSFLRLYRKNCSELDSACGVATGSRTEVGGHWCSADWGFMFQLLIAKEPCVLWSRNGLITCNNLLQFLTWHSPDLHFWAVSLTLKRFTKSCDGKRTHLLRRGVWHGISAKGVSLFQG